MHGFALDGRMWDAQIAEFAADYTVIRYDLRGFGRSPVPHARYTQVADLRRILAELGIPRAAIVGLSLGGQVAVDFALAYPAATAALITVDAALSGFRWSPDFAASLGAIYKSAARWASMRPARIGRPTHCLTRRAGSRPSRPSSTA